jgi:cytochrome c5
MNRRSTIFKIALSVLGLACLGLIATLPGASVQAGDIDGKAVFEGAKCSMCHAVPSQGIEAKVKSAAMLGPAIDNLSVDPEWLAKYLKKEESKDGKEHKKAFSGSDEELKAMVSWMLEQKSE